MTDADEAKPGELTLEEAVSMLGAIKMAIARQRPEAELDADEAAIARGMRAVAEELTTLFGLNPEQVAELDRVVAEQEAQRRAASPVAKEGQNG